MLLLNALLVGSKLLSRAGVIGSQHQSLQQKLLHSLPIEAQVNSEPPVAYRVDEYLVCYQDYFIACLPVHVAIQSSFTKLLPQELLVFKLVHREFSLHTCTRVCPLPGWGLG